MKSDKKELKKRHQQAVTAEVNTAAGAGSVEQRLHLVELYRKLALSRAARSELTRVWRQFPQHQMVLTAMLDMLTEQKAIPLLTPLVSSAQRITDPGTTLRLATARAWTLLRRFDAAAAQYAELLKADKITLEALQQLAEFVCSHPIAPVLTTLKALAESKQNGHLPSLLLYVLCRVLEAEDYPNVDMYLDRIQPNDINQTQIAFDLARLSFRFGKWDRALAAAKWVLRISPEHESARSLLVSAYSFEGHLNKAARCIRTLTKPYPPLPLSLRQLTAILEFAAKQQKLKLISGVTAAKSNEENNHQIYLKDPDGLSHEAAREIEGQGKKVSVSVTGATQTAMGPWDILVKIDWTLPHVMVQQLGDSQIFHAFVPSEGPDCWRWQEVPIFIKDCQWLADKNQVRFIPADFAPCDRSILTTSNLFKQVEKELTSIYIQKELQ